MIIYTPTHKYGEGISLPNFGIFCDVSFVLGIVLRERGACNDANVIPTRSRYASTYAAAIAGQYGWEGLGSQGWVANG